VLSLSISVLLAVCILPAVAREASVAVATNFLQPAREIASRYQAASGDNVRLVAGSTGKLAAQIVSGAPFDILLAADRKRPAILVERGVAVAGSQFTYAVGRLAFWSAAGLSLPSDDLAQLDVSKIRRLAVANPKLAPYGLAAEQALRRSGKLSALKGRIVYGENVGQTFAMTASGNATAGLVAQSQLMLLPPEEAAKGVAIPQELHDPIRQDAVLLVHGRENPAALAFLDFLRSEQAADVIRRFGYGVAEDGG
jgi:molybdate transport system substrate-binding protein